MDGTWSWDPVFLSLPGVGWMEFFRIFILEFIRPALLLLLHQPPQQQQLQQQRQQQQQLQLPLQHPQVMSHLIF